jgi:outer membrane protein insertion porin family
LSIRIWCIALLLGVSMFAYGQSGTIKEIVINGNKQVNRVAIEAAMRTKAGQPYIQSNLDQDKRSLEEMGWFQAVDVQARLLDDGTWQVVVNLSEYPVVKEIRVVGNAAIKTEEILKQVQIKPGEVFNFKRVKPSVDAIRELYTKRGYFVNFDAFGPLQDSPETLNISIVEYTVGSIKIEGLTRTRESVIRKMIRTKPGEPYNAQKWERDLGRMFSTHWFEEVKPTFQASDDLGQVDLSVRLKEGRTGTFNIGVQLDPRSSFAGVIRLADTNFRGTGQTVSMNFLQATTGSGASLDLDYVNPFIDNSGTSFSASLYSRVVYRFAGNGFGGTSTPTNDSRYTERRTGGTFSLTRPFKNDTLFSQISLRAEDIKTEDLSTSSSNNFIQQDGVVAILAAALIENTRDVDADPARGHWIRLLFEPGYSDIKEVGGQASNNSILGPNYFLRHSLEYRGYFSSGPPRGVNVDESRRVLAVRARYGNITGQVPFFEQFFVGGSDTLRGYPEDRFWGREFLSFTAEYRIPFQKSFNGILFVDWAGAWGGYGSVQRFTQSPRFNMHLGYGFGVSFRSPLGPIRLDFGFNENGGSRTHFLIGTSF